MGKNGDLKCKMIRFAKNLIVQNAIKEYEISRPMTMFEPEMTENVRRELKNIVK